MRVSNIFSKEMNEILTDCQYVVKVVLINVIYQLIKCDNEIRSNGSLYCIFFHIIDNN